MIFNTKMLMDICVRSLFTIVHHAVWHCLSQRALTFSNELPRSLTSSCAPACPPSWYRHRLPEPWWPSLESNLALCMQCSIVSQASSSPSSSSAASPLPSLKGTLLSLAQVGCWALSQRPSAKSCAILLDGHIALGLWEAFRPVALSLDEGLNPRMC